MSIRWLSILAAAPLAVLVAGCPEETEDPPPKSALEPPPAGQGFQFGTGEQPVGPGEEVQNCFFFKVKDLMASGKVEGATFNLNRVTMHQAEGSHHMNIFRVRTIVPHAEGGMDPAQGEYRDKGGTGPCFKSTNWADWPLVANTQIDGQLDWQFPEGVANKLDPEEYLMVQSHFVNASTQQTPSGTGEVFINFWHLPDSDVVHEMGTLFATKQSIRVCQSNPNPEYAGSCQVATAGEPVTVVGANAHFHSRGKQFEMFNWDGVSTTEPAEAPFYVSDAWEEPPMAIGSSLATIQPNGGVFYTCSYQWVEPPPEIGCAGLNEFDKTVKMTPDEQLDCCYTFGGVVDKNEHCNIFVYYYPKSENVFCN